VKALLALVASFIIYTNPSYAKNVIELSCPKDYLTEMSARVLTEAYRRIGITIKLRIVPAERSLYQSNSGDTDGEVGRIHGIENTYTNLIKVPTPVSYFEVMAFTKNLKFQVNGWESLKPYRIVARRGIKYAEKNTENMNREFTDKVVCGIFSKKKDHGMCGLYHQSTTPGGVCHGQKEFYRIGV
jgi:polar amino acid transport system substrate-binding protein